MNERINQRTDGRTNEQTNDGTQKKSKKLEKRYKRASICWLLCIPIECTLNHHSHPRRRRHPRRSHPIHHCACVFEAQFLCKLNGTTILELSAFNSSVYLFRGRVGEQRGFTQQQQQQQQKSQKRY